MIGEGVVPKYHKLLGVYRNGKQVRLFSQVGELLYFDLLRSRTNFVEIVVEDEREGGGRFESLMVVREKRKANRIGEA